MALRLSALLVLAVATARCLAEYEYDYGYGYDFYDTEDDFYYDEYGYYGDEDEAYYEYYGYYADDFAGYEDYYTEEYDFFEECFFDTNGKPVLANGTVSCDVRISAVDQQADNLNGGLDGVYKLSSCHNGKPLYKRETSPPTEDRVLWYSSTFGDWDISNGSDPNEAEILMYGGEMEHASVPLLVSSWHLGGDLKSDTALGEDDYLPIDVNITCADGTVVTEFTNSNSYKSVIGPALTAEEIEAKYRYIYATHKSADPSPTINFTFVVLLVMSGLTVVLAIPYFLLRKKGAKGNSISLSFAQMLSQSKKKSTGHIN